MSLVFCGPGTESASVLARRSTMGRSMTTQSLKPYFVPVRQACRVLGGCRRQDIWDLTRAGELEMLGDERRRLISVRSLDVSGGVVSVIGFIARSVCVPKAFFPGNLDFCLDLFRPFFTPSNGLSWESAAHPCASRALALGRVRCALVALPAPALPAERQTCFPLGLALAARAGLAPM